jgi:hypothetical protein
VHPAISDYFFIPFGNEPTTDFDPGIRINQEVQEYVDLSGYWIWEGRPMQDKEVIRNGRMHITLQQEGNVLFGDLIQINGPYGDIPENGRVAGWDASVTGNIFPADSMGYSMVQLHRKNLDNDFEAIFTGNITDNGKCIEGYFVNNGGLGGGWFVMKRKNAYQNDSSKLSDQRKKMADTEFAREEILHLINEFQQGIVQKDRKKLNGLFDQLSLPVTGWEEDQIIRQTAGQFIDYLVTSNQMIEEKLKNVIINVYEGVGVMTCNYDFIVDDVKQGSGSEIWTLIKTEKGWRIGSFLWSG